jgi:hypothetical protein
MQHRENCLGRLLARCKSIGLVETRRNTQLPMLLASTALETHCTVSYWCLAMGGCRQAEGVT